MPHKLGSIIDKAAKVCSIAVSCVGAVGLFFMMAVTVVDVIGRYFLNAPLKGAQDIVSLLMIIAIYGGMPFAVRQRKVLNVDIVTNAMSSRVRCLFAIGSNVLCLFFLVLMCNVMFGRVTYFFQNLNQTTNTIKIPYAPFYLYLLICSVAMVAEFVIDTVKYMLSFRGKEADQ